MHQDVPYSGSNNEIVYLTQLEYDALTTAQKKNGKVYFVTDLNNPVLNAAGISYDNTNSSLIADDVQDAIDEIADLIKNTVTTFTVDLTGWTSDATSQSGTTLYKKQVLVNHVYVDTPTVDVGSTGVLPTVAEQESYNLLQYVTCDDSVPCLYLYASAIPTTAFYISVVGVD